MRYLAVVPFVTGEDLLRKALNSVSAYRDHLVVLDNSEDGRLVRDRSHWDFEIQRVPDLAPLSFSQTMNLLRNWTLERHLDAAVFMHHDAEASSGVAEALLETGDRLLASGDRWGAVFTNYDTLCLFAAKALAETGPWDANLPQYFADDDYYYRIQLAGFRIHDTGLPVVHHNQGASTIRSDPRRWFLHGVTFPLYKRYYLGKWGGAPGAERYSVPFDNNLFSGDEPRSFIDKSTFYQKPR